MKTKSIYSLAIIATAGVMIAAFTPLFAGTDERIESSAENTHIFKTYLKDDSIKVESKNGNVTLTGSVNEESHKSLAEDTVYGLPGVKSVENQLKVKTPTPEKHSDKWISLKVKTILMFHRNVSYYNTDVSTENGIVTLRGEASSEAQKDLTTEYAQDVEYVKTVRNEMTVSKKKVLPERTMGEKLDDASITAQVKSTLNNHRSTSAVRSSVRTVDGVVSITGMAKNEAEKSLVSKLAEDVHGVQKVINEMTINNTISDTANPSS